MKFSMVGDVLYGDAFPIVDIGNLKNFSASEIDFLRERLIDGLDQKSLDDAYDEGEDAGLRGIEAAEQTAYDEGAFDKQKELQKFLEEKDNYIAELEDKLAKLNARD